MSARENGAGGLLLWELSWPEIREIKNRVDLVLLPVGSNEQHGPNLAVNMDIASCSEFCRRASARMYPRVAVAPPVPWGVSFHHMNFPGTITLSTETFIQVLVEVIASLQHHGFERFLIVNGHGGNVPAMNVATVRAREELQVPFVGACSYFSFGDREITQKYVTSPITGHACEVETARAMALVPQVVKHGALAKGEITELQSGFGQLARKYNVSIPYKFDQLTRNGALGDATQATEEFGRELMESALTNFTAFCDELVKSNPV
ncbi:MAG TPA: creatininase family protein [Thermomicrobiaceae bacterium]|nr:creatininase family protein [Thermomicrobiaceae bacterium]